MYVARSWMITWVASIRKGRCRFSLISSKKTFALCGEMVGFDDFLVAARLLFCSSLGSYVSCRQMIARIITAPDAMDVT